MFSFFYNNDMSFSTVVRPILCYWEPKVKEGAQDKAAEHFRNSENIPIEKLAMARARVHAERQHHTLAIIHAVMALEVVVPEFINRFLKNNGVSEAVVDDFNHKFGLSVRVKAFLKVILPKKSHGTIDNAGAAIKHRNKILHEGLQDASLSSVKVNKLVQSCDELINNIETYSKKTAF